MKGEELDKWVEDLNERAREQTLETLPDFLNELKNIECDYNTAVYVTSAAAIAAAWAMNDVVGLSGFQASFVMWEFIDDWMGMKGKPKRLLGYDDMMYPQYEGRFTTIPNSVWEWMQKEAKERLGTSPDAHPNVIAHWKSIADGKVPFGYKVIE